MPELNRSKEIYNKISNLHDGIARAGDCFIRHSDKRGIYFKATNLSADHFFTTRRTDLSALPFATVSAEKQIHSAEIVYINDKNLNDRHFCDGFVINEDSFEKNCSVTDINDKNTVSCGIAIRTADCTPILMYDPTEKIAAAVHAGWKGSIKKPESYCRGDVPGIAANAVRVMCKLGAAPERIQVAIGSCIHKCCFEVREDFISAVHNEIGECADMFLTALDTKGKKRFYFDLPALNIYFLQSCGVKSENISLSPYCTACNTDTFFSFRAEHGLSGLMLAAIRL